MKKEIELTNVMIEKVHKHCFNNKEEISKSHTCGCFYCKEIFAPSEIKTWINDKIDKTAQCPYCMVDAVIGDASGYQINTKLLENLHNKYFK